MGKIYRNGEWVGYCQPGWEWIWEVAQRAAKTPAPASNHPTSTYEQGVKARQEFMRQHPELFPEPEAKEAPVAGQALTIEELADRLHVSVKTIRRKMADKTFPKPIRMGGTGKTGKMVWPLRRIEEWESRQ